jgi:hypothetical protein
MGAVLTVLLAAFAARAEQPLLPSQLREGWREARNNLLWWHPYDTFDGTNTAFELAHGLPPGGAVRCFGEQLLSDLVKPDGGDSNRVAEVLNRLVRSGTYDVTNVLAEALFRERNAFRYQTLLACINAWPPDMSGLAEAVVARTPPETRAEWYVSLVKKGSLSSFLKHGGDISWRELMRIGTFLGDATRSETNAVCAAVLDKAQLEAHSKWKSSNHRKRLALRFRDAGGEAGDYFSKLSGELGPLLPPTARDIDIFVSRPGLDWPDDASVAGYPPASLVPEWYRNAYRTALLSFDVPKRDFIRMIADRFEVFVRENEPSPKNSVTWHNYVSALRYGADPVATNALIKAVDAAWIPGFGASQIDWAMCSCDPAWETSEARRRFAVRIADRSPKQFTDVSFFRDLLHQIGRPKESEAEK